MDIPLTRNAGFIIDRLRSFGHRADIVGGAVRDYLLGKEVGDCDITTSCRPNELKELFSDCRILDTGIRHGTVTILVDGEPHEVTTYRTDGEYLDSRHPESISFSDTLAEDLSRRDFTVNALCYNPYDGLTDMHGGVADLNNRIIRTVGDPECRFEEDALRILRGIRFAAVLDFNIEPQTSAAIRKKAGKLSRISAERIYAEWKKLLSGKAAHRILADYSDVVGVLLPELKDMRLPCEDSFVRASYMARFISLFLLNSTSPASDFETATRRLKTDNLTRTLGYGSICAYLDYEFDTEPSILHAMYARGADAVKLAVECGMVLGRFSKREYEERLAVIDSTRPYRIGDLALRGGDLAPLGIRGVEVGRVLEQLLFAVIDGLTENTAEALIALATQMKEKL